MSETDIDYSSKYKDDIYEYRHVILPNDFVKRMPYPQRLLNEVEWRALGICQSVGWIHYMLYNPEPNVLLFRRLLNPTNNENEHSNILSPIQPNDPHKLPLAPNKPARDDDKPLPIKVIPLKINK